MSRAERAWLCLWLVPCLAVARPLPLPLQDIADRLPESERVQLLERHQRLSAMNPARHEALKVRIAAWDALPPTEQTARREVWLAWRTLPAHERERMRAAHAAWEALPQERRQALRARFDALDAGMRRGWLLGPTLGADWPRLHGLFSQVPADQRQPLLDALHALPPQALDDLAVLSLRTPPEEREALRAALLARPVGERARWLRARVAPP